MTLRNSLRVFAKARPGALPVSARQDVSALTKPQVFEKWSAEAAGVRALAGLDPAQRARLRPGDIEQLDAVAARQAHQHHGCGPTGGNPRSGTPTRQDSDVRLERGNGLRLAGKLLRRCRSGQRLEDRVVTEGGQVVVSATHHTTSVVVTRGSWERARSPL